MHRVEVNIVSGSVTSPVKLSLDAVIHGANVSVYIHIMYRLLSSKGSALYRRLTNTSGQSVVLVPVSAVNSVAPAESVPDQSANVSSAALLSNIRSIKMLHWSPLRVLSRG